MTDHGYLFLTLIASMTRSLHCTQAISSGNTNPQYTSLSCKFQSIAAKGASSARYLFRFCVFLHFLFFLEFQSYYHFVVELEKHRLFLV